MALTPGLYRPQADSQRPLLFINDFQTQLEAQPDKAGQWEARLWGGGVGRATRGAEKTLEKKTQGQDVCSTREMQLCLLSFVGCLVCLWLLINTMKCSVRPSIGTGLDGGRLSLWLVLPQVLYFISLASTLWPVGGTPSFYAS